MLGIRQGGKVEFPIGSTHVHFMMHIHAVLFWFIVGEDVGALTIGMVAAAVFGGVIEYGGGEGGGVG